MRVKSRLPLVLTLLLAIIGLGLPVHSSAVGTARAQGLHRAAPAAGLHAPLPVIVSVSPNPTGVAILTTFTIKTAPNAICTITIQVPANPTTGVQPLPLQLVPVGADSLGNATETYLPDSNAAGGDLATVSCLLSGFGFSGSTTIGYSVLPSSVSPSPTPGPTAIPGVQQVIVTGPSPLVPGSTFSLNGGGFPPGSTLTITGFVAAAPLTAQVQPNGAFVLANIQVPYTQAPGRVSFIVRNSNNTFDRASVQFVVTNLAPKVTLDTTTASYGDLVGVSGSGFGGNEVVDVSLGPVPLFTVKADNTGNFSGSFNVPNAVPFGQFSVAGRGESTSAVNFGALAVSPISPFAPTGTITPTPAPIPPTATPGPPTATASNTPIPVGPTQATTFLAEGTSGGGERVQYTMLNPSSTAANTTVTLLFADGAASNASFLVPARSVLPIDPAGLISPSQIGLPFSAKISADQRVSVSRRIVRSGKDGDISDGATAITHYAYFAEGYTGSGFRESLALINAVNANATVDLKLFSSNGGVPIERRYIVGPLRRYTIDVNALAPNQSVAASLVSDVELAIERTLVFGKNGNGMTTVPATDSLQPTWYFAEGSTKNGFSEFITLANPSAAPAAVTTTFMDARGRTIGTSKNILAAGTRATINVGKIVSASSVGAMVQSDTPILAERTLYRGALGSASVVGTGAFGRAVPRVAYIFPSGDTGPGNAEFLLLLNPSATASVGVQLIFYTIGGSTVPYTVIVPAHSRLTVDVARSVPGLSRGTHGVIMRSTDGTTPFVAEQSLYTANFSSAATTSGVAADPGQIPS